MNRSAANAARDQAAVADIVGSILMVGITVIMAAAFAILLFSFKGPTPTLKSDVAVSVDPGAGGWGTGDETVRILHRGGDSLAASVSTVTVTIGATKTSFNGATALGSTWGDGKLTIGETWQHTYTIASGASVQVALSSKTQGSSQLLASSALVASAVSSTQPCAADTAIPTVILWSQSPNTITGSTSTAITITARLTDDCWGVNPNTVPDLYWRITPAVPYTDQGAMTNSGINTWTGTVPAQSWSSQVGKTLQYHVGPLTDLGGNSGNSPDQSSVVALNCASDITPPVGSMTKSPADVTSATSGAVTVTVTVTDDCSGVSQTTNPHLFYRFNDGTNPAYTDGGAATNTGVSTWQGSIPSQVWATKVNQVIEYYFTGMRDLNGNLGTTGVSQDVVDGVFNYNYVASNTPTTGTVSFFANAQSATDSGAEATVAEGAVAGSSVTQLFTVNGIVAGSGVGWSQTSGTLTAAVSSSNANWGTYNLACGNNLVCATGDLKVDLENPPSTTGTVSSLLLRAEVSINPSDSNDGFELGACISGGACTAFSPSSGGTNVGTTDTTLTYDLVAAGRPGGGSWSLTDLQNLQPIVRLYQGGSGHGTWRVNYLYAQVTFTTTTYTTSVAFGWTAVPAGTTHALELKYRVTGDTYDVQVCQDALPTCGTWTTRGSTLNAASSTVWSYALTTPEYNAGAPRVRFTDLTPGGSTQGNLFLDYARVSTV